MRLQNRCTVVLAVLLLLAMPGRAQAGGMPDDPRGPVARMEEATARLHAGAYLEAAELFALASDGQQDWPFADDAALCRIQALEAAGQDDTARDLWRSWLADHPGSPLRLEARLACAWNHLRDGDSTGAERVVQDATAAEPWAAQDPQVRLVQAACALAADAAETALEHLAIARRGGPTDLALMLEGCANERLDRDQAAAVVYQELIDEHPESPLAGYALMAKGRIFASAESYRAAARHLDRTAGATTRADLKGEVEYLAAACRFLGGEREAGLAAMQAVATGNAGQELAARSLFSLGEMLWMEQRYEPAISRFNEVLSGYFSDDLAGRALYRIGRCLDALGRTVEANTTYQAVADGYPLAPEAPAAVYLTGVGLLEQERFLAAAPYFQLLLDRYAGDGAAFVFASAARQELVEAGLCLLEYAYYRAGETGLMAGAPHLALQAMPASDSIWRAYALLLDADALAAVDRHAEAQTTLTGLLAACPDHAVAIRANRLLAWTYASQSREDLAIATEQSMLARYSAQDDAANLSAALLTIAHSHFNAKRYAEAAEQYRQYVQRFPGRGHKLTALYQEGLCYSRLGRSGDAVDTWRLVTDEAPTSPEARQAWLRSGDVLFQAGHYGEARECYNSLMQNLADSPAQATATLRLARCDYNEDRGSEALARFREVTTAFPDSPEAAEATEGITQILYNLGREGDLSALQDLVQSYPDSPLAPEAGFELALAAYDAGDYAGAAAQFDELCARYPRYSAADRHLYYATDSHGKAGDAAAARDGWAVFLRRFPASELAPAALFNLARSRFDEGQYTAAAADFGRVLDLPADQAIHAAARLNLAMSQRILGHQDLALATLQQCLRELPDDDPQRVAAAHLLGEIHQEIGHPREAAQYYQEAVAAGADPATAVELNYLAGLSLKEAGDVAGALAAFNQAIQSPDKADYYRLSALAQAADLDEQSGNVKAALRTYRDLIENATDPALVTAANDRVTQLEATLAP